MRTMNAWRSPEGEVIYTPITTGLLARGNDRRRSASVTLEVYHRGIVGVS